MHDACANQERHVCRQLHRCTPARWKTPGRNENGSIELDGEERGKPRAAPLALAVSMQGKGPAGVLFPKPRQAEVPSGKVHSLSPPLHRPVESSLVYSAQRRGERERERGGGEADTWPGIEVVN